VKQIRKRITYANVMSSIAVFLVLGGASAYAAKKIGSNEIKGNSITTGKLKKNAVTASKIKKNSITTAKIKNGAVTGPKVNVSTLGTVPNATRAVSSATTDAVKASKGSVAKGGQATAFEYGAFKIVVNVRRTTPPKPGRMPTLSRVPRDQCSPAGKTVVQVSDLRRLKLNGN
jgi:hypothetical protein